MLEALPVWVQGQTEYKTHIVTLFCNFSYSFLQHLGVLDCSDEDIIAALTKAVSMNVKTFKK